VTIKYRVALAQLTGKTLKLRLTGPDGNAMVSIGYLSKTKQVGTLVKTVPANKVVKLRLAIPKGVQKLHLSVLPS